MSQHDMNIADQFFPAFRADLNDALVALVGNNSGAAEPAATFPYMYWADTTAGWLKQRNAADTAWIRRHPLGTGASVDVASAATLDLTAAAVTSNYIRVTGTTTTTAITLNDGEHFTAVAAAAWPLTHGASLILPGAENYTCAAGDILHFRGESGGVVRVEIQNGGKGKQTIWIPAVAMTARTTSGAGAGSAETTTNKIMVKTLNFDAATAEYAQFAVRMPKSWNKGTVTATFLWSNADGTGNVVWGLQGVALSDDDVLDAAFGTAQTVTDGVTAAGDLMQSAETSAITIAGAPAAGDLVVFQAYRDAANGADTLASDARLHGVTIFYTTDAANDA